MVEYGFFNSEVKVSLALRAEQGGEAVGMIKGELPLDKPHVELEGSRSVGEPSHWALGVAVLAVTVRPGPNEVGITWHILS